jgi:alpha-tubulin suppressor-like RCC1 family protein/serine/threonine protein kinase
MIDERDELEVADLEDEYELLNELGRGGSAVVYRARDKSLGREVAIKVVRTRIAGSSDDAIERLAREARTVAKLTHANIVTVYAVKRLRDGGLALVMQLVPGRTLKQAITEKGAFSADEAERVIREVAQALAYAHVNGVVHRDVKPENIFLDSVTGSAMLSDFGIAYNSEYDSRLTMTGAAIGTPAYMSPEQIDGAPANARSDVYSLGLVAWEMLTGERPWEGETLYNVIFKQKHEELPSIDELRPNTVPPRLQYIIERMLQKKPNARWASADSLLNVLTAWVIPADWRQWEEAHQRRRALVRAATKGKATPVSSPTPSGAGMATVRFPRPKTPSVDQVVIPTGVERKAHTPAVAAAVDDDDDAPSWASEPVPVSHRRRNVVVATLAILLVAGSVAGYAWHRGALRSPAQWSSRVSDGPKPTVVAALATPTVRDSVSATIDSSLRGTMNDSAAPVGSVPAGVSQVSPAPTTPTVVPLDKAQPAAVKVVAPVAPAKAAASPAKVSSPDVAVPTVRSTDDRGIIAAGGRHSCSLSASKVFCWGANDRGQLGDGESESRDVPGGIALDLEFAQISAGNAHSCGVTRSGDAYCWGSDERGQLGDATTTSRNAPVRVAGNLAFQLVRTGTSHTCGLTVGGEVACWGANDNGQLGDGTTTSHYSPVTIKTPVRFIGLTTGWNHSCAISFDGTAYCWGDNSAGQLGDGTRSSEKSPTVVNGGLHFTSIAAGRGHTCAVADNGDAYCWGKNTYGQLGTGNESDQLIPARVETSAKFVSVSLGAVHSCARTRAGQIWCWGQNVYGQLGDGSTTNHNTPTRVTGGTSFTSVSATGAHTCATSSDGDSYCWGYNTEGQLGDGTRNSHSRPMRVTLPGR